MDMISIYFIIGAVGLSVICVSLITVSTNNLGKSAILAGIGVVIMLACMSLAIEERERLDLEIEREIALHLNTEPNNIIVKELREESGSLFFKTTKNADLKEVLFDGKKYTVQIKNNHVLKVTEN